VEWCFRTSFHEHGTESAKIWETMATYRKLVLHFQWPKLNTFRWYNMVVEIDRLTTLRNISDRYLRESNIPQLADKQVAIFKREFSKYLLL
jgi:hypothetical protein